jgi:hypothetical protein
VKRCNRCGIEKSVEDFYKSTRSKDGAQGYCKACDKIRRESPERMEAKRRSAWLWSLKRFSLTEEGYQQILEQQNGVCAICEKPDNIKLAVDHDHACCDGDYSCGNCIRGLLCKRCNMAISLLGDDPHVMTRATSYLRGIK